jgi:hypothetical protein
LPNLICGSESVVEIHNGTVPPVAADSGNVQNASGNNLNASGIDMNMFDTQGVKVKTCEGVFHNYHPTGMDDDFSTTLLLYG